MLFFPAAAAWADGDRAVAEVTKVLQGAWKVREAKIDGQAGVINLDQGDFAARRTYGKDGTYKVEIMGQVVQEGTWKVVAVKGKAVHLDTTPKDKRAVLSILEVVDTDTVRLCSSRAGAEKRPTKYEVTKGSKSGLFTLKRVKDL